jgi:hypothetical protein
MFFGSGNTGPVEKKVQATLITSAQAAAHALAYPRYGENVLV